MKTNVDIRTEIEITPVSVKKRAGRSHVVFEIRHANGATVLTPPLKVDDRFQLDLSINFHSG